MARHYWKEEFNEILDDLLESGWSKKQILAYPAFEELSIDVVYKRIRVANGDDAPDPQCGADSAIRRRGACQKHLDDLKHEFGELTWPPMTKGDIAEEYAMEFRLRRPPNLRMMGETYA